MLGSGSVARPSSQLAPGPKARANGPERAPARAEARYSRGLDQARDQAPQAARSPRPASPERLASARSRMSMSCSGMPTGQASVQAPQSDERNGSLRPSSGRMSVSSGVSTAPIGPL